MPNPGGAFKFKVGQRVWVDYMYSSAPHLPGHWARIKDRKIEAALGKTYWCVTRQRSLGYVPENWLHETPPQR